MLYIYAGLIPLLIIYIKYLFVKRKLAGVYEYIYFFLTTTPYLFAYSFFLYFLEMENYVSTGWAFYTILFFLCPLTLICFLIKVYFWFRTKN
jgi:hypothetical protein